MSALVALSDELEALVARVRPGVVGVEQRRGQGTGVALSQDGYILTNEHVALGGRSVGVRLASGERLKADLVGSDGPTDLAVLRVHGVKLQPLALAEGRPPAVGQLVVAIGNPFRFEGSVSFGLVSALDRSLPGPRGGRFEGLIQTDAAINPGNSGGPLVNARAEVVGINTAVIPFAQGMGFAIGAATASWVAAVLIHSGEVRRRYLGLAARSVTLPPELASATGQPRAVQVLEVAAASPAEKSGIRREDYLLSVHGKPVGSVDDVHRLIVLQGLDEVEVELFRSGERQSRRVWPRAQMQAA